jgi:hypothetical protein
MELKLFKIALLFVFIPAIYSCNGQSNDNKQIQNASSQKEVTKVDSLYFTYNSDVYSNVLILTKKKQAFFETKRNKNHIITPVLNLVKDANETRIKNILDSASVIFAGTTKDYIKIGAPYSVDQGGYELVIIFSDKSTRHISIDTNENEWPQELKPFLSSLKDLYMKTEERQE